MGGKQNWGKGKVGNCFLSDLDPFLGFMHIGLDQFDF